MIMLQDVPKTLSDIFFQRTITVTIKWLNEIVELCLCKIVQAFFDFLKAGSLLF